MKQKYKMKERYLWQVSLQLKKEGEIPEIIKGS
jgi:hypothetical protein